jgi:hypothetical protein
MKMFCVCALKAMSRLPSETSRSAGGVAGRQRADHCALPRFVVRPAAGIARPGAVGGGDQTLQRACVEQRFPSGLRRRRRHPKAGRQQRQRRLPDGGRRGACAALGFDAAASAAAAARRAVANRLNGGGRMPSMRRENRLPLHPRAPFTSKPGRISQSPRFVDRFEVWKSGGTEKVIRRF